MFDKKKTAQNATLYQIFSSSVSVLGNFQQLQKARHPHSSKLTK